MQQRRVTAAAEDFKEGLDPLDLPTGTILVIVPGHEVMASNEGCALARAAHALAKLDDRYIASVDSLIRIKTVPKKTDGGSRDIEVDLSSVVVKNSSKLKSNVVVVLDDTMTTAILLPQRGSFSNEPARTESQRSLLVGL